MAGLQRSEVSFRRQGSSGLVWDDRFLSGELNHEGKPKKPQENQENVEDNKDQHATTAANKPARDIPPINITIERSRSNGGRGGRGYRTGRVSPAVDPPSPKVSACGFCSAFGKESKINAKTKPAKRRSR